MLNRYVFSFRLKLERVSADLTDSGRYLNKTHFAYHTSGETHRGYWKVILILRSGNHKIIFYLSLSILSFSTAPLNGDAAFTTVSNDSNVTDVFCCDARSIDLWQPQEVDRLHADEQHPGDLAVPAVHHRRRSTAARHHHDPLHRPRHWHGAGHLARLRVSRERHYETTASRSAAR